MTFQRDTSPGYLVNLMARLFARQLDAGLKPLGLALGAFPALLHLWEKDGLTQKDLVDLLGIEQPTMAATLSRMERDGLITRSRDADDGRVQRVWLTEKARSLQGPATAEAAAVNERAMAPLPDAEKQAFLAAVTRIIAALDRDA
jgi:DNA-binding MarR family transcriptional regulator